MIAHDEPIDYVLAAPADDRTRHCCGGTGAHTPDCRDQLPAGAVTASEWKSAGDGEMRIFRGEAVAVFESEWLSLRSAGYQFRGGDNDGYLARTIELLCEGLPLRPKGIHLLPSQAVQLATALTQAAYTVGQLDDEVRA